MPSSTSDRIHALPVQLANQIAAGEVVERPASVVKELVENSIDAGASRIDIDLREGGKSLIRVEDDGKGIHADDFKLALTRHATSKLHELDDLQAIHSLGFRGEALPSIASVCRFEMSSRYRDSDQAWQVSVDSQGLMSALQPHAQACGTTVTVAELFCNTPARRRFLRAARTEFLHVQDVVMRAALSRFDIAFRLNHNGREVLRLPAINDESMRDRRLASVGGKSFQQALQPVYEERDGVRVHGWLAPAEAHRAQADRQFVFINGRMVRDKVLNHAIRQAYADALPPGRYAMYALYVELDASRVDVNVHPTKHEVRFREVRPVHDVIFSVVQHGLRTRQRNSQQAGLAQTVTTVRESATVYALNAHRSDRTVVHAPLQQTSRQHIASLLPGGYALVVMGDDHWLYNLQQLAQVVFTDRLQRQQTDRGVITRPMLIPQRIDVDEQAADRLDGVHNVLSSLGVDITRSSNTSVLLRGLPEAFTQLDANQFVTGLVELTQIDVAAVIGCAVKSLAGLGDSEVQQLLASLSEEQQATCRRQLTAEDLHDLYKG